MQRQLTPEGQLIVSDLASRYGVSNDAISHMLYAVLNGNGSMAQFNHPEFGGGGQWMSGGMTMVGDMFNNGLKATVDNLCTELSGLLTSQPGLLRQGSFQSQQQSGGAQQSQSADGRLQSSQDCSSGTMADGTSLFVPGTGPNDWWPRELGQASATGSQNNIRYAYFAPARRLAVDVGGQVWLYDTLDHQIGGFSQQQGSGGSITFTSQYGTVLLSALPVIARDGLPVAPIGAAEPAPKATPSSQVAPAATQQTSPEAAGEDIFSAIERLGDLKAKGLLSDEEFSTKKAELLARL